MILYSSLLCKCMLEYQWRLIFLMFPSFLAKLDKILNKIHKNEANFISFSAISFNWHYGIFYYTLFCIIFRLFKFIVLYQFKYNKKHLNFFKEKYLNFNNWINWAKWIAKCSRKKMLWGHVLELSINTFCHVDGELINSKKCCRFLQLIRCQLFVWFSDQVCGFL